MADTESDTTWKVTWRTCRPIHHI